MRRAALMLLLCLLHHHAQASPPPPLAPPLSPGTPALTLAQALAYSQDHQPELQRGLAQLAVRRGEAQIPRAQWLPRVGATAQLLVGTATNTTASYLNAREVDLPRIGGTRSAPDTSWTPYPSTLAALSAQQQVYDFGRIAAQTALADALTDVARAGTVALSLDIRLRVQESFQAVLSAKQIFQAAAQADRRAQTHLELAEAGVRSGMRPPIERTRAQADVARAGVQRARAAGGLAAARAALAAAIGASSLEVDALPSPQDDTRSEAPTRLEDAIQRAAALSPELAAALAQLRAQQAATMALTRELLPDLFLSGSLSGRAGGAPPSSGEGPYGAGWLPSVGNWDLALVLRWSVIDPVLWARRKAARERERVAQAEVEVVRRAMTLEVQRAHLELTAAQQILPGLTATVTAGRANLEQAEARFRAGLGTIVELADAEALLVNAELELAIGAFTLERSRARFDRALGAALAPRPSAAGPLSPGGRPS